MAAEAHNRGFGGAAGLGNLAQGSASGLPRMRENPLGHFLLGAAKSRQFLFDLHQHVAKLQNKSHKNQKMVRIHENT